jgi:hypothetical protein
MLGHVYEHCPNVKKVTANYPANNETFWKLTLEPVEKGNLRHLQDIPIARLIEFLTPYYLPIFQRIRLRLK